MCMVIDEESEIVLDRPVSVELRATSGTADS